MIRIFVLLFILNTSLILCAQERRIFNLPEIPGYQTLSCDLHMHTVFSDGSVWPTVRVDEAWKEGIDVIAITDHLEYLPHKKDITADHNRSWEIAQQYAKNKDVIVIAGTEITKNMPPEHFNALFIKDANTIKNDDYKEAIREATVREHTSCGTIPAGKRSNLTQCSGGMSTLFFLIKAGYMELK